MARFERDGKVFEITSSDGRYTTELRTHLREGWTRVCDPRCEEPLGAEPQNPVLEAALRADPDDLGSALVYADWLQQQGHPRGALIAVQHRLATSPHDAALIAEERRIIDDARAALLSKPLLAHLSIRRTSPGGAPLEVAASRNLYAGGAALFDHGFMCGAQLAIRDRVADEDLLWELLRHPSARFLSALELDLSPRRDLSLVAAQLVHGPRPPLRTLRIRVDAGQRSHTPLELAGLAAAYPDLLALEVAAEHVWFSELELRRLHTLAVTGARRHDLEAMLAGVAWPALESLTVGSVAGKLLEDALARPIMPRLRTLSIDAGDDGLRICRAIARSPLAPQLEHLALREVPCTDAAITLLVEQRDRFAGLGTLCLVAGIGDLERLRAAGYPIVTA